MLDNDYARPHYFARGQFQRLAQYFATIPRALYQNFFVTSLVVRKRQNLCLTQYLLKARRIYVFHVCP